MSPDKLERALDPVTFEVLKNAFATTVDMIAEQIIRTCHSFVIYNRDFSSGIGDAEGNTVTQGKMDISVHVATLHHQCKSVIEAFRGDIHDGDVFLINDPYAGGTHFNDVSIVRPVFAEGELIAFLQSKGHWTDVGGSVPGSFDYTAKDMFGEGIRIPAVRVVDKGVFRADVANLIAMNTRDPDAIIGDMMAQSEATKVGERNILRLVKKYGKDTVTQCMQEVQDYAERSLRKRLSGIPDGTWEAMDFLDHDPVKGEGMIPVKIRMTIKGDQVHFDFAGSNSTIGCLYNSCYGTTMAGIVSGMKMFFPDIPLNSGFYRPITYDTPEDSVVDARWPVAVSGFLIVFEKIVNAMFDLMSNVVPERTIACSYNLEYCIVAGKDGRNDSRNLFLFYDWLAGGWGGRMNCDGSGVTAAVFGTGLQTQPSEGQERLCPLMAEHFEILTDSAGPGQFRGGVGARKTSVIRGAEDAIISYFVDRERSVVWGLNGGLPSLPHGMWVQKCGDDEPKWMGACFSDVKIENGDRFSRTTAGGGGHGDPLLRDPAAVIRDIEDDYVSVERAKRDYGVVVNIIDKDLARYALDEHATEAARAEIRAARKSWLQEDPESVARRYRDGELNSMDLVRFYGVILEWGSGELLPVSTDQYREQYLKRSASHWQ